MMELNPDTVCAIIDRAREFHGQESVTLPEVPDDPDDDWALQVLADHADDLTYQDAKSQIDDLEPDQQVSLVALMWLGRGDYDEDQWEEALIEAGEQWTARTAEYLMATPLLADYLAEGLSMLGYSCDD